MTNSSLFFQVQQLRARNLQRILESIATSVLAFVVAAFLPSLLVKYLYAGQQLFEEPALLGYIPVACFVVAVGYFIYAMVTNAMREMKAMRLEKEVMTMSVSPEEMTQLQGALKRVESAVEKSPTRTSKAKKTTRRK